MKKTILVLKNLFQACLVVMFVLAPRYASAHDSEAEGFTVPQLTKDNPLEAVQLQLGNSDDDKDMVFFIDTPFMVENEMKSTGMPAVDS